MGYNAPPLIKIPRPKGQLASPPPTKKWSKWDAMREAEAERLRRDEESKPNNSLWQVAAMAIGLGWLSND